MEFIAQRLMSYVHKLGDSARPREMDVTPEEPSPSVYGAEAQPLPTISTNVSFFFVLSLVEERDYFKYNNGYIQYGDDWVRLNSATLLPAMKRVESHIIPVNLRNCQRAPYLRCG